MLIEFFNVNVPKSADGDGRFIAVNPEDYGMFLSEVQAIREGWRLYDVCFSSILFRRSVVFRRIGNTTFYKRREYA